MDTEQKDTATIYSNNEFEVTDKDDLKTGNETKEIVSSSQKALILFSQERGVLPTDAYELVSFSMTHQPQIPDVTPLSADQVIMDHANAVLQSDEIWTDLDNLMTLADTFQPSAPKVVTISLVAYIYALYVEANGDSAVTADALMHFANGSIKYDEAEAYVQQQKHAVFRWFCQSLYSQIATQLNPKPVELALAVTDGVKQQFAAADNAFDYNSIVTWLLNELSTGINAIIPGIISQAKLDPYEKPWSTQTGKQEIKIKIKNPFGFKVKVKVGASASVKLTHMVGLSKMRIAVESIVPDMTKDMKITAKLKAFVPLLTFKATGRAEAHVWKIKLTPRLHGKVKIKDLKILLEVSGTTFINATEAGINKGGLKVVNAKATYKVIDTTDIGGLGPLDPLITILSATILNLVKGPILNALVPKIEQGINGAIENKLPITKKF